MKSLCYLVIFTFLFFFNFQYTLANEKSNSLFKSNAEKIKTSSQNTNLHSIFTSECTKEKGLTKITSLANSGWLKFLQKTEDNISPTCFHKNNMFYQQAPVVAAK